MNKPVRLATPRLQLRDFQASDVLALNQLYVLPETSRYESWAPHESVDESRDLVDYWISRQGDSPRTDYTFAIDLDGRFIGLCGIELGFGTETDDLRAGFVGYRIYPSEWRRGYATEALKAVLAFGFETLALHRIHSGCVVTNQASARVLEKAGLKREGVTRSSFPIDDAWYDYAIYGILQSEWR